MDEKKNKLILDKIEKYCLANHLLKKGDAVVIGVSGGADSVFLTYVLRHLQKLWNLRLEAVHVNHGIRGEEAGRDQRFVKHLMEELQIPLTEYETDIPALASQWKKTEEEAGREFRYRCFEEVRKKRECDCIAVAHHQADQAETVMFRLLRGSGLRGLGGMRPHNGNIIRPLLFLSKEEILETLKKNGIEYCIDSTNGNNEYARNFIRNVLFPQIREHLQKNVDSHIAASARKLQEAMDYIDWQAESFFHTMVGQKDQKAVIQEADFCSCHSAVQKELILKMIESLVGQKKDITGTHVENVCMLFLGETGKQMNLPYHLLAKKDYDTLSIEIVLKKKEEDFFQEELQIGESYEIPLTDGTTGYFTVKRKKGENLYKNHEKKYCTKCFDYDKISSVVMFRYPMTGDYLWLDTLGRKKKLSRLFIDEKVSVSRRKRMVVLAEGNHILWIPELGRCSAFYYLSEETMEMIYIHEKGEEESYERSHT